MKQKEFKTKIEECRATLKTYERRHKFGFWAAVGSIIFAAVSVVALIASTAGNVHKKKKALAEIKGSDYYAATVLEDELKLREEIYIENKSIEEAKVINMFVKLLKETATPKMSKFLTNIAI